MIGATIPGLERVPVIGILRKCPPGLARSVGEVVAVAGLRVLEVTMDSDHPLDQIRELSGLDLTVGVGSVLAPDVAFEAISAGARFVVTPVVDEPTITACAEAGVPVIPGAATPTEVHRARSLGATAVKVFPADLLGGPRYLRSISSPLGDPPLVPTGGVSVADARDYLAAGAVAIGAGGSMFPPSALAGGDLATVRRQVAEWVEAVT